MRWFAVHAILYFEYKEGKQGDCLVWEHVYLIKARSPREAGRRGVRRAKQDEGDDGDGFSLNNRPARLRFGGIRQICECIDLDLKTDLPTDGTELSYSEYTVSSRRGLAKLVAGKSVTVTLHG